jgi:hypothetical protein
MMGAVFCFLFLPTRRRNCELARVVGEHSSHHDLSRAPPTLETLQKLERDFGPSDNWL